MSYSIRLIDKSINNPFVISYIFAPALREAFDTSEDWDIPGSPEKDGIRKLYGMTGEESIPVLTKAIENLDNYYKSEKGSKETFQGLYNDLRYILAEMLVIAHKNRSCVWSGD